MRECGYYWVKFPIMGYWEVMYFDDDGKWYSIWDDSAYDDKDLEYIDERRIVRNEVAEQC